MAETAMNPETRHLTQVDMGNAKEAEQAIEDWLGKSVDNRKELISNNLNEYVEEVINE